MKVVLINPPQVFSKTQVAAGVIPPIGLMYLASALREAGHLPVIIDSVVESVSTLYSLGGDFSCRGLALDEIVKRIPNDTGLVGISNHFSFAVPVVQMLASKIKNIYPAIPIIVGGAHPSAMPKEVILESAIDFVGISEGENTIVAVANHIGNIDELMKIDGLAFKDRQGVPHITPKGAYIEDLDQVPFPARDLVPLDKYCAIKEAHGPSQRRWTPIISSRGCPFQCTFCTPKLWGRRYRVRSAENVLEEIEECMRLYNITEFHFEDENLTVDKQRTLEICNGLRKRNLHILWQTPNGIRASTTDEEMLDCMKASGCYHITVAPESGSQRVLNNIMHKQQDLAQVTSVVKHASKIGLKTAGYFMMGLPGETIADVKETGRYARKLARFGLDEVVFSNYIPLPGSDLFDQLVHEKHDSIDWQDLVSIGDIAKARSWAEDIPSGTLKWLRLSAYLTFHLTKSLFHPVKVIHSIFNVLTQKEELKTERVLIVFIKRSIPIDLPRTWKTLKKRLWKIFMKNG